MWGGGRAARASGGGNRLGAILCFRRRGAHHVPQLPNVELERLKQLLQGTMHIGITISAVECHCQSVTTCAAGRTLVL